MWVLYPFDPERRAWSHPELELDARAHVPPQHNSQAPWEQSGPNQPSMNGSFTSPGPERGRWSSPYSQYSPRAEQENQARDFFTAKPTSSRSARYPGHYDHHRAYRDREQPVSFEQASTALYEALEAASRGCQKLETSFQSYTRGLSLWLPAHHMDPLWTKYMDWDGRPVERVADADEAPPKADPDVPTYCDIQRRLGRALSAAFTCAEAPSKLGPGIDTTSGYATPSWQILRTTTRKLRISLEAIEELLGMVRVRRDCMPSLVHEILAAMQLLESIRPLWDVPTKPTSTPSKEDPYDPRRSREL